MPYTESDLLPLSALQHLLFCERQCALIHVEQVWAENRYTAEGRVLHKKAHDGKPETRDGVRITRGLPLHSFELGLSGQADVVLWEWRGESGELRGEDRTRVKRFPVGARLNGEDVAGWVVTPVEYKRGKPKTNDCDRVQLCAQGMCLEEMLSVRVGERPVSACPSPRPSPHGGEGENLNRGSDLRPRSGPSPHGGEGENCAVPVGGEGEMRVRVPRGQLFYGQKRRRFDVEFDAALRETTRRAAARLHEIVAAGITPAAVREKKCDTCSLLEICMPDVLGPRKSARRFFERELEASLGVGSRE